MDMKEIFILINVPNHCPVAAKLKIFGEDGDEKIGVKGVTPSKSHQFWPICLLPVENFATFVDFSFLFLNFSPIFLPPLNFSRVHCLCFRFQINTYKQKDWCNPTYFFDKQKIGPIC